MLVGFGFVALLAGAIASPIDLQHSWFPVREQRAIQGIPQQFAKNITVYHVNPASAGQVPIDMDTGDSAGDLFFYLTEFLLPEECSTSDPHGRAQFDCDNPERVDPNLVVRYTYASSAFGISSD